MGMVGGGSDAFIGAIHRRAAFMDNQIELVCGCFSVDPEISKSSGLSYFLPEDRIYSTYQEMFEHEMTLPEGERMDFVTIVTPNRWHFEPAMMALERGFHVVVDKPMTFSLEEAKQLQKKVEETGLVLADTCILGLSGSKRGESPYRERRTRKIAPRLCRIYARMAFRTYRIARWQQCRMAHGPETFRQSRLHRGYRNTRLAFERIYYRTESQRTMCRPEGIRSRTSDR